VRSDSLYNLEDIEQTAFANDLTIFRTLKQGDYAAWNGTDFLALDKCTGLVKEVDSSEDLINFMYNLGVDSVEI
jgi:hypothetical protein